jgi:hypothetical protein
MLNKRASLLARYARYPTISDDLKTPTALMATRLMAGETVDVTDAAALGRTPALLSMVAREMKAIGFKFYHPHPGGYAVLSGPTTDELKQAAADARELETKKDAGKVARGRPRSPSKITSTPMPRRKPAIADLPRPTLMSTLTVRGIIVGNDDKLNVLLKDDQGVWTATINGFTAERR